MTSFTREILSNTITIRQNRKGALTLANSCGNEKIDKWIAVTLKIWGTAPQSENDVWPLTYEKITLLMISSTNTSNSRHLFTRLVDKFFCKQHWR